MNNISELGLTNVSSEESVCAVYAGTVHATMGSNADFHWESMNMARWRLQRVKPCSNWVIALIHNNTLMGMDHHA